MIMNEGIKLGGNNEIDQALKEFEAKSGAEEAQTPSLASDRAKNSEFPMMVRIVMKLSGGAIKEQRTAEYVLLGFVVIALAISFYLFFGGGGASPESLNPGLETLKNIPLGATP